MQSTVLAALAAEHVTVQEPVGEWDELLQLYYADPAQWALTLNLRVLLSHAAAPPAHAVFERSPAACRHVFSQLGYNDGHLTPRGWELFKEYWDELGWEPDAYVYIATPADACMRRIAQRGRPYEHTITPEYLARIEFQYDNMLRFTTKPVVRVDGTRPPHIVRDDVRAAVAKILSS